MKISDEVIDAAVRAGYAACGTSCFKPDEYNRRWMRGAFSVFQKMHEEDLKRVLGPVTDEEFDGANPFTLRGDGAWLALTRDQVGYSSAIAAP